MKKFGKPLPETIEEVEPDWLSGCTKANIDVLYKLANFYHVSIDYLFGLRENRNPEIDPNSTEELRVMGFSDEALDVLWANNDFVEFINELVLHVKFNDLIDLISCPGYTLLQEEYDQKYRSFLLSQLLYQIITDIINKLYNSYEYRP